MPHRVDAFSFVFASLSGQLNTGKSRRVLWCAAIASSLLAAGCATNTASLPQLPGTGQAPGFGFTTPNGTVLATAVVNRQSTYTFPTTITDSTALRCSAPPTFQATPNGKNCVVKVTPTSASTSTTLTVTAGDVTKNQSVTGTFSFKINAILAITPPSPDPTINPAVIGRPYGQGSGISQAPTWTASGGLPPYTFSVAPSNPAGLNCQPLAPATSNGPFSCSTSSITGSSTPVQIQVTVTDAGDNSTSTASASSSTSLNLTLNPEMTPNWNTDPSTVSAVNQRAYGVVGSGQTSPAPPKFTVTNGGGLPPYNFPSASPSGGLVCAGSSASLICQSNAVSAAGGSVLSFNAQVSDTGNAYTPSKNITLSTNVHVNPAISIGLGPTSPDPALNVAVQSRSYGEGSGCTGAGGTCLPVTYVPTNGTGSYAAVTATGAQNGIICSSGTSSSVCSTHSNTVTNVGGSITITARDVANAYTPSGAPPSPFAPAFPAGAPISISPPATDPSAHPAVRSRTYGEAGTSAVPATWSASGGLPPYTFTTQGAPPAGISCVSSQTMVCSTKGNAGGVLPSAVTSTFTVGVSDKGNASVPAGTMPAPSTTITVKPEMTPDFNFPPETNPPVTGRSFGEAGTSGGPAIFQVTNAGGLGGYTYNVSAQPGGGIACTTGVSPVACSTASTGHSVTGSGPLTPFQPTVVDTPNAYTPSNTIGRPSGAPTQINSKAAISVALALNSPNPTQNPAVVTRTYGQGTGCSGPGGNCATVTYAPVGGTGNFAPVTATGSQNGITCSTGQTSSACTSSAVTGTAGPGINITAQDLANAFTPSGSGTLAPSFQINPEIISAWNTDPTSAPAVQGRAYGKVGSGQTSAAPPTFIVTNSGGLGGYNYSVPASPGGGLACAGGSASLICQTNAITAAGGGTVTINPQVSDTANATTPTKTVLAPASSVPVKPEMTPDFNFPPETNPPVTGRSFGEAGTSGGPAIFQVTNAGGLGGYTYNVSAQPGGGIACTTGLSPVACSTASTGHSVTGSGSLTPFQPTVTDTPNAYTPSTTVGRPSGLPTQINANGPVSIASAGPDPATNPAVQNLSYGFGTGCLPVNACQSVAFTASGGTGKFNSLPVSGNPASLVCNPNLVTATVTCSSSALTDPPNTYNLSVNAQDQANQFTPAGGPAAPLAKQLVVNPPLAQPTPAPGDTDSATPPDAENGNAYGVGTGIVPLSYNVSGGIGPYFGSCNGVGGLAAPSTPSPTNVTCSGPNITQAPGPATLSVVSHGTANQTTPPGSSPVFTAPTLTVHPPLTFTGITEPPILGGSTAQRLPNLLVQTSYSGTNGFAFNSSGGIGSTTWAGSNLPGNMGFGGTNNLGGIPSPAQVFNCNITVKDAGNTKSPPVAVTVSPSAQFPDCPALDTLAYVADPTKDTVQVIRTGNPSGNTPAAVAPGVSLTAGDGPASIAITPNGRFVYVALNGSNKLAVIDSTTINLQVSGSPFALPAGCNGPRGVGVSVDGTRVFVACSSGATPEIVVIETKDNTTVDATISVPASSSPEAIAVQPDGKRVYVTLKGSNQLVVIDETATPPAQITNSPFSLPAGCTGPKGIAVTQDSARIYFACSTGNEVAVVATDDKATKIIEITTGASTAPDTVAMDPSDATSAQVFVTLNASSQLAVFDNTLAIIAQVTGSPFNLPDPAGVTASGSPLGIAIPPQQSAGNTTIYIAFSGTHNVAILDKGATHTAGPVADVTPSAAYSNVNATGAAVAVVPLPH